jgi:hypothetical protein
MIRRIFGFSGDSLHPAHVKATMRRIITCFIPEGNWFKIHKNNSGQYFCR